MLVRTTPVSGLNSTGKVEKKRRKGSEGEQAGAFAVEEETGSVAQSQTSVPAPALQGVDSLLALQQMDVQVDDRRRAVQHGNKLLDQLDALRMDLLQGRCNRSVWSGWWVTCP